MRALILAVSFVFGAPGVAGAAVTPGDYGGGALRPPLKVSHTGKGSSLLWARVSGDGRARIGGSIAAGCGLVQVDAEVTPAPDGSFRFSRYRLGRGEVHKATVEGRFDGAAAAGTLRGRFRYRRPDGRMQRCRTGRVRWQLRLAPPAGAPAAPQAGAQYYGLTSQATDVPGAFMLRVTRSGARVDAAWFDFIRRCKRRSLRLNEVTPSGRIRADGTFSLRDRFTLRYGDVRLNERFKVIVDGQFSAGAVSGTLRATSVARKRGTGRVADRCDTGPVTFSATL